MSANRATWHNPCSYIQKLVFAENILLIFSTTLYPPTLYAKHLFLQILQISAILQKILAIHYIAKKLSPALRTLLALRGLKNPTIPVKSYFLLVFVLVGPCLSIVSTRSTGSITIPLPHPGHPVNPVKKISSLIRALRGSKYPFLLAITH